MARHAGQKVSAMLQSFTTFVAILYNICCNPCVTLFFKLGKKNYNNVAKNYNNVAKNYNNVVNNYNVLKNYNTEICIQIQGEDHNFLFNL